MQRTLDATLLPPRLRRGERASRTSARAFLEDAARGEELVSFFWPAVMAYLRIATRPAVFETPLPPVDAVANVQALLSLPHIRTAGDRDRFWRSYREMAVESDAHGSVVLLPSRTTAAPASVTASKA